MNNRKWLTFFEVLLVLGIVLFPVVLLCIAGLSSLTKHFAKKSISEKLADWGKKLWDNREYLISEGQKYLDQQRKNAIAYADDIRSDAKWVAKDMRRETKKQSKKLFGLFG